MRRTVESDSRTGDGGIFPILLHDVPFFCGKMLDSAIVGRAYLPVPDFSREPTRHSTIRCGWLCRCEDFDRNTDGDGTMP